jgi:hypothetical protein
MYEIYNEFELISGNKIIKVIFLTWNALKKNLLMKFNNYKIEF